MIAAPIPSNEAERMREIDALACSYAPREERFDRITRSVCALMNVPIALVTVVDKDIQWLRSVQGLAVSHTPRDISFCGHVVAISKPLIVSDALRDERFHDNPLVTGEPFIRAYAGMPLVLPSGSVVGSLCAIDTMPRTFGDAELQAMRDMADIVVSELQKKPSRSLKDRMVREADAARRGEQIDFSTGRWNRAGLMRALQDAMAQARRGSQLALLVIRVTDWKASPAADGGEAGSLPRDAVFSIVAQHIQQRLPEESVLTRPEPDTFCVVVPGLFDADVEKLLESVMQDVTLPRSPSQPMELALTMRCNIAWVDASDYLLNTDTVLRGVLDQSR